MDKRLQWLSHLGRLCDERLRTKEDAFWRVEEEEVMPWYKQEME